MMKKDGNAVDLDVLISEEKLSFTSYNRLLGDMRVRESKAYANAPRHIQRVHRGYLPREQSAEPRYLPQAGTQASARDIPSHFSYSYESPFADARQYPQLSNALARESHVVAAAPSVERSADSSRQNEILKDLMKDMDEAYSRIRALERRIAELHPAVPAAATSVASAVSKPVAVPTDIDQRVSRLEAKIAEVGQNGAEQREKLSARLTELQSSQLRVDARFGTLEGRIEKVVDWNNEWKAKEKQRSADLGAKLTRLETMERRLKNQRESVDKAIDALLEKTSEMPAVVTFGATEQKKREVSEIRKTLQEARSTDDNA